MDVLETLVRARAEVEKGWCQRWMGQPEVEGAPVCAMGGVRRVIGRDEDLIDHPAYLALCRELGAAGGVSVFNDRPSTTHADVLALFDRAINSLVPVGDPVHVHRVS